MSTTVQSSKVIEFLGNVLHVAALVACVAMPWLLHFYVGWWAGLISWFILTWVYKGLFVPRGSICMGIPFGFALGSFLGLLVLDFVLLIRWCVSLL